VKHSRVARTDLHALRTLGVGEIRVCGPQSLLPDDDTLKGCIVGDDFDAMLEGADALMMLRLQRERMEEGLVPSLEQYHAQYGWMPRASNAPAPMLRCCTRARSTAAWKSPTKWPTARSRGCCARSPTASPYAWPCWKPCWVDCLRLLRWCVPTWVGTCTALVDANLGWHYPSVLNASGRSPKASSSHSHHACRYCPNCVVRPALIGLPIRYIACRYNDSSERIA